MDVSFAKNIKRKSNLLEPGIYDFVVYDAINEVSKNGNEMIKLILKIENNGKSYHVFDYLVAIPSADFKINNFVKSTGLENKLEEGKLTNQDCFDQKGKVEIKINHDENGIYSDRNVVKKYVVNEKLKKLNAVMNMYKNESNVFYDDLPF